MNGGINVVVDGMKAKSPRAELTWYNKLTDEVYSYRHGEIFYLRQGSLIEKGEIIV